MGSLASHPKVPPVPQTPVPAIYNSPAPVQQTPAPVASPPAQTTPDNTTAPAGFPPSPAAGARTGGGAAARTSNLLERSRGLLSTVLTGFRGILSDTTTPKRKNLLGE